MARKVTSGIFWVGGESAAGLERMAPQPSGQARSGVGKDANCRRRRTVREATWKTKLSPVEKSGDVHP